MHTKKKICIEPTKFVKCSQHAIIMHSISSLSLSDFLINRELTIMEENKPWMKPQSLTTSRTVSIQKLKAVTIQALPLLSHKICIHIDLYNIYIRWKILSWVAEDQLPRWKDCIWWKLILVPLNQHINKCVSCMFNFFLMF